MSTAPWPGPLRRFLEQLDGVRAADVPDLEEVGRLLAELAADEEFFDPRRRRWSRPMMCTTTVMSRALVPAPTR